MNNRNMVHWMWLGLVICLLEAAPAQAFYNPQQGRWINRDPIGERRERNVYVFLLNCGPNFFDALGLETLDGFNLPPGKYCNCIPKLLKDISFAKQMSDEYEACGNETDSLGQPLYKTGGEINECVFRSLRMQGIGAVIGGSTDGSGNTQVNPSTGDCAALIDKAGEVHENTHSKDIFETRTAERVTGTAAFMVYTEKNAYAAEAAFNAAAISIISKHCRCGRMEL